MMDRWWGCKPLCNRALPEQMQLDGELTREKAKTMARQKEKETTNVHR